MRQGLGEVKEKPEGPSKPATEKMDADETVEAMVYEQPLGEGEEPLLVEVALPEVTSGKTGMAIESESEVLNDLGDD